MSSNTHIIAASAAGESMGTETAYKPHPLRIQRKRTKGYRLPDGAVCCTRPGLFGNPFDTEQQFRIWMETGAVPKRNVAMARMIGEEERRQLGTRRGDILRALADKRDTLLACWCPLTRPCHTDVLCELANQ